MKLIIVRGIPGSGKSTYSEKLRAKMIRFGYKPNEIVHYEADMYLIEDDGEYRWTEEKSGKAHKWCYLRVKDALDAGKSVIVSNTFLKRKAMKEYFRLAKDYDADLEIYHCMGRWDNIHAVPIEKLNEMKDAEQNIEGETIVNAEEIEAEG